MNELVSIVTPAYNAERYISKTIDSVINQTYTNWEMLIVDDCSIDNTKYIIKEYSTKDHRIRIITMPENVGVANARNEAIKLSKGEYIAFLDSDDIWRVDKLEKQITFMANNKYDFTFTDYELINKNGNKLNKIITVPKKLNYYDALKGNSIPCLTVMINKKNVGLFRMPNIKHEDYATWLNILKNNITAYGLNENLAMYRKSDNSITSNKFKSMFWTWNIYYKNQNLGFLKSVRCMINYILKNIKKRI